MTYSFNNFHKATTGKWTKCATPTTPADFVSGHGCGSKYWDCGSYVIRQSDHWGDGIKSCSWFLNNQSKSTHCGDVKKIVTARIDYADLRCNKARKDALIKANFLKKTKAAYSQIQKVKASDLPKGMTVKAYKDAFKPFKNDVNLGFYYGSIDFSSKKGLLDRINNLVAGLHRMQNQVA